LANTFLMVERDRWPLWLAVALGAGSAGYFALAVEPPVVLGWAALVLGLSAAALTIKWHWRLGLVAALLLGFGLAKLREEAVATPVLDHAVVAHLTGRIASLEPCEHGVLVVLDEVRSGALQEAPGLPGLRCDGLGCVVTDKLVIAASLRPEAFLEDCIRARVVVSTATMNCEGPAVAIDGKAAENGQGWRITLSPTPSAVSVRSYRGMPPWVVSSVE
jgi:hypothetical protein